MQNSLRKKPFDVMTIAGNRYTVTLDEVYSWFTNIWWWGFLGVAMVILVTLMPHNQIYDLNMHQRFLFWPMMTAIYLAIYILCIRLGARYATRKAGRYYYTPFGMIVATIITTYLASIYIGYIHNEPPDFGLFKGMEVIFNMLWASIFEAFHFAYNVPRLRKKQYAQSTDWEHID